MLELFAIFTMAWLLVLIGTVLIFDFIVPFHYWGGIYDSAAKGVFATILGIVWLYALNLMRDVFVRRNILTKKEKVLSD